MVHDLSYAEGRAEASDGSPRDLVGTSAIANGGRRYRSLRKSLVQAGYSIGAVAVAIGIWQLVVWATGVATYVVPAPADVYTTAHEHWSYLLQQTWPTLWEIVIGFGLAVAIGIPLAILIVAWRGFERGVYPLVVGFQGIPKVALAPMVIVWLGLGLISKVVLAALIAFFPVVIDTVIGLRSIDAGYVTLARSMGANRRHVFWRMLLPNALPQVFGGLKIAMSLAVVGAIVAELLGSNQGLGYLLNVASGQLDMSLSFTIVLWLAALNVLLIGVISLAERLFVPWSHHGRASEGKA